MIIKFNRCRRCPTKSSTLLTDPMTSRVSRATILSTIRVSHPKASTHSTSSNSLLWIGFKNKSLRANNNRLLLHNRRSSTSTTLETMTKMQSTSLRMLERLLILNYNNISAYRLRRVITTNHEI